MSGSYDSSLKIWDINKEKYISFGAKHDGYVTCSCEIPESK